MKISIRKPLGYSQIGRKDQQEDAVWPPFASVTDHNHCLVLCDGVGGSAHGEIASQTVSTVIGEYLTTLLKANDAVSDKDIQYAVGLAYDELDKVDTGDAVDGQPSMATTLTCVCIHNEGILAAHMGDSRIYLVRPGQGLLYQSSDHSLVNALLQAGELTLEEAKTFPRKNVITKALQPHIEKRFNAEIAQLTDIQGGDYVFMCCDGVLEQLTNERLVEILSMDVSDEKKISLLEAESVGRTKDNFTAYLIPIDKVDGVSNIVNDDEVMAVVENNENCTVAPPPFVGPRHIPSASGALLSKPRPDFTSLSKNKVIFYAICAILLAVILFFVGRCSSKPSVDPQKEIKEKSEDKKIEEAKDIKAITPESDDAKKDNEEVKKTVEGVSGNSNVDQRNVVKPESPEENVSAPAQQAPQGSVGESSAPSENTTAGIADVWKEKLISSHN